MKSIYFDLVSSLSFKSKRMLCYLLEKKGINYKMVVPGSKINYFKKSI
jgi:hypothetical protein